MARSVATRLALVMLVTHGLISGCAVRNPGALESSVDRGEATDHMSYRDGTSSETLQERGDDHQPYRNRGEFARAPVDGSASGPSGSATKDRRPASLERSRADSVEAEGQPPSAAPRSTRAKANSAALLPRPWPTPAPKFRPGLATQWGEYRDSWVTTTAFERASGRDPDGMLSIRYNDMSGTLIRAGLGTPSELEPNETSMLGGVVTVRIIGEAGSPLPGCSLDGHTFVSGRQGDRYSILVSNRAQDRFEVVVSVDGLDVIDGLPASTGKRGYLLESYSTLQIEGFRRSREQVATFRFASVRDSYAARTGSDRNVGVIGVALFREDGYGNARTWDELNRRDSARAFPVSDVSSY